MLVFVLQITPRINYVFNLILRDLAGIDFTFSLNKETFIASPHPKLSYNTEKLCDEVFIPCSNLLFETGVIKHQNIKIESQSRPDDIFAASFFFASRYEEYLPFEADIHGRFSALDSLAFKKNVLHLPIVNIWVEILLKEIKNKYPNIHFRKREFKFINTIDIDSVYAFKNKGILRNTGGFLRDCFKGRGKQMIQRIETLAHLSKDPFDTFDFLTENINKYNIDSIFFFQVGDYGVFDKNINIKKKSFQTIIRNVAAYYSIGLHPSYKSNSNVEIIKREKECLEDISAVNSKYITSSRFHFLHFTLPTGYRALLDAGITDDYSMGFSEVNGFRAGLCTPFHFYDLLLERETSLMVHPFAIMDVTLLKNSKEKPVINEIRHFIDITKSVNGEFISIFHNQNLVEEGKWKGWREIYRQMLAH
ncbi:MAG: polysaccharide deacetylase family protein [Bacteroidales bacterium]|jgi:hypothetical protein|nr:polysaccharide deacetylase family protein [Bacteroidales bacterium]